MLIHLSVKNFSLINSLEIDFKKGLTIITGETGAGKSVLLGALGLILGQRTDTQSLLDRTRKCVVEGIFNLNSDDIKEFLINNDLDDNVQLILRREIAADGRSRAFINDTPVNLSTLKDLASHLVDIHSQHETLTLASREFQLKIVDVLAENNLVVGKIKILFKDYSEIKRKLVSLKEAEANAKNELDFITFQFEELNNAELKRGEQELLEQELETLNNSEEIKSVLVTSSQAMNGTDENIISALSELKNKLQHISKYNTELNTLFQRVESCVIELKDIASELEESAEKVAFDPQRAEEINNRLSVIYHLQSKHRLNSVDELIKLKNELQIKLDNINSYGEEIERSEKLLSEKEKELRTLSIKASENRKKIIPHVEEKVKKSLSALGMPAGVLKIDLITDSNKLTEDGIDDIKFLFSANKGINYNYIEKVASGGELSRVMLAVKSLVAKAMDFPTLIFDEIDTGISGETAFKVGKALAAISEDHQVIAITHLPQIAGKGNTHFFVYKTVDNGRAQTFIKELNSDERVVEIAKMIGGEKPSGIAIESAKELLNQ